MKSIEEEKQEVKAILESMLENYQLQAEHCNNEDARKNAEKMKETIADWEKNGAERIKEKRSRE